MTFTVAEDTKVTGATNVGIRFRNLVGQRYIALTEGEGSGGETRTKPEPLPGTPETGVSK